MQTSSQAECRIIPVKETYKGKQGHTYFTGVSAQSTNAQGLCMHLLILQPEEKGLPHMHEKHETAIYIISGEAEMWYGDQLQHYLQIGAGNFLYIPAGVPHLPSNPSQRESCHAIIARTDPNEQESTVLLPELEKFIQFQRNKR